MPFRSRAAFCRRGDCAVLASSLARGDRPLRAPREPHASRREDKWRALSAAPITCDRPRFPQLSSAGRCITGGLAPLSRSLDPARQPLPPRGWAPDRAGPRRRREQSPERHSAHNMPIFRSRRPGPHSPAPSKPCKDNIVVHRRMSGRRQVHSRLDHSRRAELRCGQRGVAATTIRSVLDGVSDQAKRKMIVDMLGA